MKTNGPHIRLVLWKAHKAVEAVDKASIEATGLGLSDFAVLEALQGNPAIRERTLMIALEDLQARPVATLERLWDFCQLDAGKAAPITAHYADKLGPSSRRSVDDAERALLPRVWEIVAPVARQLGYEEPDYDKEYG